MLFDPKDWLFFLTGDVLAFFPELALACSILLLLLIQLFPSLDRIHLGWVALSCTIGLLLLSLGQWNGLLLPEPENPHLPSNHPQPRGLIVPQTDQKVENPPRENAGEVDPSVRIKPNHYFSRLVIYDHLTQFIRIFLLLTTTLIIWLFLITGIPDRADSCDFHVLLLGATLGLLFMVSANHLLMMYLALEMASLGSYALAGFLKGSRLASEASLKYIVFGAGASGIMLYGISLIVGHFDGTVTAILVVILGILFNPLLQVTQAVSQRVPGRPSYTSEVRP